MSRQVCRWMVRILCRLWNIDHVVFYIDFSIFLFYPVFFLVVLLFFPEISVFHFMFIDFFMWEVLCLLICIFTHSGFTSDFHFLFKLMFGSSFCWFIFFYPTQCLNSFSVSSVEWCSPTLFVIYASVLLIVLSCLLL